MEMLCPECLGPLTTEDGKTARCTIHGGQYNILFPKPEVALQQVKQTASDAVMPEGVMCYQHTNVQAVRRCKACSAPICETCDFALPGNVHLCPACATTPQQDMSGKRKRLIGWAIGLAIWTTLGTILMFLVAATVQSQEAEEALGGLFGLFVMIPCLIGTALGVACFDKRLANPPIVWVAGIWNFSLLAIMILLVICGSLG